MSGFISWFHSFKFSAFNLPTCKHPIGAAPAPHASNQQASAAAQCLLRWALCCFQAGCHTDALTGHDWGRATAEFTTQNNFSMNARAEMAAIRIEGLSMTEPKQKHKKIIALDLQCHSARPFPPCIICMSMPFCYFRLRAYAHTYMCVICVS